MHQAHLCQLEHNPEARQAVDGCCAACVLHGKHALHFHLTSSMLQPYFNCFLPKRNLGMRRVDSGAFWSEPGVLDMIRHFQPPYSEHFAHCQFKSSCTYANTPKRQQWKACLFLAALSQPALSALKIGTQSATVQSLTGACKHVGLAGLSSHV